MDATKNPEKRALIVESNDQSREFQSKEKMVRRVFCKLGFRLEDRKNYIVCVIAIFI